MADLEQKARTWLCANRPKHLQDTTRTDDLITFAAIPDFARSIVREIVEKMQERIAELEWNLAEMKAMKQDVVVEQELLIACSRAVELENRVAELKRHYLEEK
jgi:hypothetical protein